MKMTHTSSILSIVLVGAMFFASCSKTEKANIRMDETATVTIPDTIDRYSVYTANSTTVTNSLDAKLSEAGYTAENVKEVRLEALELNLVKPTDETFKFCRSVSVYLVADGMTDTLIGSISNPTRLESAPLFLFRQASDLKEYFTKPNFSYKAVFQMRQLYSEPIEVLIKPIYFVSVEKEK
ncbi:MAG: hypothetical protein M0R38_08065 [Bacteroidia bacterium]|nr:hypothetical protein [Bacteroidia bacterium]